MPFLSYTSLGTVPLYNSLVSCGTCNGYGVLRLHRVFWCIPVCWSHEKACAHCTPFPPFASCIPYVPKYTDTGYHGL